MPPAIGECFNFIMADIFMDVCEVLDKLIGQQPGKMTEAELIEYIYSAIEVVIKNRRK
jgi:hypothetical protein